MTRRPDVPIQPTPSLVSHATPSLDLRDFGFSDPPDHAMGLPGYLISSILMWHHRPRRWVLGFFDEPMSRWPDEPVLLPLPLVSHAIPPHPYSSGTAWDPRTAPVFAQVGVGGALGCVPLLGIPDHPYSCGTAAPGCAPLTWYPTPFQPIPDWRGLRASGFPITGSPDQPITRWAPLPLCPARIPKDLGSSSQGDPNLAWIWKNSRG
jgi:hypothetical protein